MRHLGSLVVVLGLAAAGCSGAHQQIRPTSAFTPQLARSFDDSVDYVQNLEGLGGRVADDWQRQISTLSHASDLIGVATIETVVLGTDVDGNRSYRLSAALADRIHGQAPEDNRIALTVSAGQNGFNTVAGKEERLQSGRYMLFVKWYTDGAGEVRAHWHLTPLSDSLLARVREASGEQDTSGGQERVVRREGSHAIPGEQNEPVHE